MRIGGPSCLAIVTAALAMPAIAGQVTQQKQISVQQDFEIATALTDKGDNAAALAAWQALEKRVASSNRRNIAIVRVRMGSVLYRLDRMDEAVSVIRAGLADLPASDASLNGYRFDAFSQLGEVAQSGLDYASAVEDYRRADSLATDPVSRLRALRGLVESETFVDSDRAGVDLARADGVLASLSTDGKSKAIFAMLRSVLLLNQGKFVEARMAAGNAVKLLGGLTSKTDLFDVAARYDYAMAALLSGQPDEARHYMALTGAGRLPTGFFNSGVQMSAPYCGGDAGLKPDDVAVIEFSIGDDGTVTSSVPIYAAGGKNAALEFARAARSWSWTPAQVKEMPGFFRYRTRVELRCSTSFARPSTVDYLHSKLNAWLTDKGIELAPPANESDALALPKLRAELAAMEAAKGSDNFALLPILYGMMTNSVIGSEEANQLARRALAIADAHRMTPVARVALARILWSTSQADHWKRGKFQQLASAALDDPQFDSPQAHAAIRLILVDTLGRTDTGRVRQLLQDISDEKGMEADDPLRVSALVRLASLEEARGNAQAARIAFEKTGMSEHECALVDSAPKLAHFGGGPGDFPTDALSWGFEGWVMTQFDVTAEGRVQNTRAIISYPPFVFSKAGTHVIANSRYEKTYRPNGELGCGSNTQRTGFRIAQPT